MNTRIFRLALVPAFALLYSIFAISAVLAAPADAKVYQATVEGMT